MEAIIMPVIVLGLTGIAMGLFLAYASKKFEVQVDPKIEEILAILPGINCGACGCPGCSGYASRIVEEGAKMNLCTPGGPKVMEKIGNIMGVAVEAPVKKKKPAKKVVKKEKPVVSSGIPISASKEFIEKNKKMLVSYKEAFDGGDKEKQEKLEKLAKMAKKEELLKYYEEIKEGKVIDVPKAAEPISASKEFIEKNKKMLVSYKEAFDGGDKEKQEKLEKLAKMAKKEELLKYYEEIKTGKMIPDPETMKEVKKEESSASSNIYEYASQVSEMQEKMDKKDEPEVQKEKKEETPKTKEEKLAEEQAASYCSVLGDGLCVPEMQETMIEEKLEKEMD